MTTSPVEISHIKEIYKQADLLFDSKTIELLISKIAGEISDSLSEANPLVLTIMNGGMVFAGKLITQLDFPLELSYLHATRYRDTTKGGELEWKAQPPTQKIEGRTVLIIDDLIDEGQTLEAIINFCKTNNAKRTLMSVLVDKKHDRKTNINLKSDFSCLDIEDRYIFGYGMDYHGYWRNAPGIFAVNNLN